MDLVAGVRKEGSRGGRAEFKWEDVKDSTHRENYLGHSLMAPVGRWQKGRDLSWYAKSDGTPGAAESAAQARREEIRKIKEAEQDALSEALGYGPMPKRRKQDEDPAGNANLEPLGDAKRKELERTVKDGMADEEAGEGRGIGYGNWTGAAAGGAGGEGNRDVLPGQGPYENEDVTGGRRVREQDSKTSRARPSSREREGRRDRSHERRRRRHEDHKHRHRHRHRSHSRDRDDRDSRRERHRERHRSRSPSRERRRRRSRSAERPKHYPRDGDDDYARDRRR